MRIVEFDLNTLMIVLTTLPNAKAADALAQCALDARLAACVTQLSAARSRYFWQGKIETADEIALLFKTAPAHAHALEKLIAEHHPYQTPEILVWSASSSTAYAQWVITETQKNTDA